MMNDACPLKHAYLDRSSMGGTLPNSLRCRCRDLGPGLKDCPMDVLAGLSGTEPVTCPCGASLAVEIALQAQVKEQGYSPCN